MLPKFSECFSSNFLFITFRACVESVVRGIRLSSRSTPDICSIPKKTLANTPCFILFNFEKYSRCLQIGRLLQIAAHLMTWVN
jgi:hypothetical protein